MKPDQSLDYDHAAYMANVARAIEDTRKLIASTRGLLDNYYRQPKHSARKPLDFCDGDTVLGITRRDIIAEYQALDKEKS